MVVWPFVRPWDVLVDVSQEREMVVFSRKSDAAVDDVTCRRVLLANPKYPFQSIGQSENSLNLFSLSPLTVQLDWVWCDCVIAGSW